MLVEKRFDAGEVELNYAESPPNGPPIILIHGTSGKWQSLQPIIPSLSMRWHVYALDLRGHGLSNRAPGKYNLKNYHKDVINFIEKKVKEPVRLFGHSMGGMICARAYNLFLSFRLTNI